MPDVDELRAALREEADRLPTVPLLPAVRARAAVLRRRIVVAGVAVVTLALVTALGVGYLALSPSSSSDLGGAKPVTDVAALVGPTWRLTAWTGADGKVVAATTDRPATLVFDSTTAAHSDDSANTTTWIVRLHKGTVFGVEGPTTTAPAPQPSQVANAALAAVLDGAATWKITGSTLVIRKGSGVSVTYSSSPAAAAQTAATGLVAVIGRTWTVTSVTSSAGRTWVPQTGHSTALHLWSGGEAQSDGATTREWSWRQSGSTIVWTRIWPTGAATSGRSDEADVALATTLQGTTSWSLEGSDKLVISGPAGARLSFWSASAKPVVGTVAVALSAVHGCGVQVCGRGPVAGAVTIANTRGIVVWRMPVTPRDGGNDLLQAGTYTVTATINDGVCTPATVTVVLGRSSPVGLSCRDGLSKD